MANKSELPPPMETPLAPKCSICLEEMLDGSLAIAKLKCDHIFHMSCIGCEFNVRGMMQCPICSVIENSDWLFCIGDPDEVDEDSDSEMGNFDANQNQNPNQNQDQNISLSPHGVCTCPGSQDEDHEPLPVIRPTRELQIGGNSINAVVPDVHIYQHSYLAPAPPPPLAAAPQSTPFLARNAPAVGLANGILNYSPPVILGPTGSAPFGRPFGVPGSSLFPPTVAINRILYGRDPPPPSIQAFLARRGPYWAPPNELNLVGLEPSLFNQGNSRTSTSADPLELTLSSGTTMEQMPHVFPRAIYYGMQGFPFEAMNPEDPNADDADPSMMNFF